MEAKMLEELHEIIGRFVDDNNHLPGHEEVVVVASHEDFKKLTVMYKNKELEKYQFDREFLNAILHVCNKIYQKYAGGIVDVPEMRELIAVWDKMLD